MHGGQHGATASSQAESSRIPLPLVLFAALALLFAGGAPLAVGAPAPAQSPPPAPPPAVTRPAAPAGELPSTLQARLRQAMDATMAEYDVPGAAVGVWAPGVGSWTSAAGLADIAGNTPASTEMTWPLRSVTKSYTVTLILQLVDDGLISLDDTIGEYVPGVTDGDAITLRELANMTSGNADYTNQKFLDAYLADPDRLFTLADLNGFMLGEPAKFTPGTRHIYTNANTNLLGAVIEKVTREPFANVLHERILQPLRQSGTHYTLDVRQWAQPRATGYAPGPDGLEPQPDNMSIFGPAGSMTSSLDDARVWGEVLATGSLLTPASQAERLQGAPLDSGPPYDIYALGIGETDGWWGHNGEGLGFTAAVFHNPQSGATIAVFMNKSDVEPPAHPADQLFRRFAEILGSWPSGSSSLGSSALESLGPSLSSSSLGSLLRGAP